MDRRERPAVIAHRGASHYAKANTVDAFRLAAAQGADGIETDLRLTADGMIVLHHDDRVGDHGPWIERSFADIRSVQPDVPTLGEAVAVLAGMPILNLEVKSGLNQADYDPLYGQAAAIVAEIDRLGIAGRALVSSFDAGMMAAIRTLAPHLTTGQLFPAAVDVAAAVTTTAAAGHTWINLSVRSLGDADGVVLLASAAALSVAVWTVDDPSEARRLAAAGVAAIITNDPAGTLDALSVPWG